MVGLVGHDVICVLTAALTTLGFDGLIINSTAFMGIELLQVTKVIGLMGRVVLISEFMFCI
jgi:hypothetical protein